MKTITLAPEVAEMLERFKTSRAGWIAFGGAVMVMGLCIPEPFEIARWTLAGFGAIFSALMAVDHYIERKAQIAWHEAYLQVYLEKNLPATQSVKPSAPPQPQDGGETPTPEFLSALFQHTYTHNNTVPSVRELTLMISGFNDTRTQAMLTRLVTWGVITGRVGRGNSGTIAEGWTHARARGEMIRERPDYAPAPVKA